MTEKIGLIAIFDTSNFNKGLSNYLGGVDKANSATQGAEKSSFSFTRALEVAVGNALVEVGKLAVAAGEALFDFGKESVDLATDFQTSMVNLQTAASDSGLSIEELGDLAIKVGADSNVLGASATGAADAMINLYRAGLKDNAVFGDMEGYLSGTAELGGILKASFDLATASELDVAQASELGIVALSVFGRELETDAEKGQFAADAMDYMVKTANASNAEVSDLASALNYAGINAADFGLSVEDTNIALGLLSNAGLKGSSAGTTLSAVMRDLKKETKESTAAWDEMGISIYDADTGATRPFIDILGDLEVALGDKTDAQKSAILQDIFTSESMKGINLLLAEGVDGWDDMVDAIDGAIGMQEQAAAQSQTFAGQMEALDGQIETLKIQFGMALLPALTSFVEAIIPIIEQYGPALADAFMFVGDALVGLVNGFIGLFSENPQGGIAELGETIGMVFGEETQQKFFDVATILKENLPQAIETLKTVWDSVVQFLGTLVNILIQFFNSLQPSIQTIIEGVIETWNALKENIDLIWQGIQFIIQGALKVITGVIGMFIAAITGDWDVFLVNLQSAAEGAWLLISGIIETAFGLILTLVGTNAEKLFTTIAQLWFIIKVKTGEAWDAVSTAISDAWDTISTFVSDSVESIGAAIADGWESITTNVSTAAQSVYDTISTALSPANMISIGTNMITGLIDGIKGAAGALADAAGGVVQGAIDAAKNTLGIQSPSKVFAAIGVNTMLGMAQGINAASAVPQEAVSSAVGGMVSPVTNSTVNNINNSRNIELNIANYGNNSGNRTYFDVVAGLQAVGV